MADKVEKSTGEIVKGNLDATSKMVAGVVRKAKQDLSFLSESQRFQLKQCIAARGACDQAAKVIKRGGKVSPDVLQACAILSGAVGQLLAQG